MVVLVIAILIAIAIPTFLGACQRSQGRRRSRSCAMESAGADLGKDPRLDQATMIAELTAIEPSITWVNHTTDAQESASTISLDDEPTFVTAAAGSRSGNCYYVRVYSPPPHSSGRVAESRTRSPARPAV